MKEAHSLVTDKYNGTLLKARLTDSNLELFTCLWLDDDRSSMEDNLRTQQELRKIINHLKTFDNSDKCEQYIQEITHEKIILIVSNSIGQEIVPRLHSLPQLSACYVFCRDRPMNEQWIDRYHKIKGIFVERSEFITAITEDQSTRTKLELSATISVIKHGSKSLQAHNAIFMWFQLFIEVLLRMHHKSTDRKELIDICKENYKGNEQEMFIINEFEKNYKSDNAIWWYTREACFYRMMNKALRVQDYDMLFALRFFITDIAKQLKNEHEKFIRTNDNRNIIRIYRGQSIGIDELELMKNSVGEYLSMNSFLSTSCNRSTAIRFARKISTNTNDQRILFEIEIDSHLKTKAFADVSKISYCQKEDEVLIMLGALFRIDKMIEDSENHMWIACVSLASEDDYQLKETFAYMKEKIGDDTNLDSLGKILLEMGEYGQAEKCYQRMLEELKQDIADAHVGLGLAQYQCNEYGQGLRHFQESLNIRKQILGKDHVKVGNSFRYIGGVYWKQGNYEEAILNLKKSIEILENTIPMDPVNLAQAYHSLAVTYQQLNKSGLALQYYSKASKVQQTHLPSDHPDIAVTYNSLGYFYELAENFLNALEFYRKSLDIRRKILPPTHEDIIRTENNIERVKYKIRTIQKLTRK